MKMTHSHSRFPLSPFVSLILLVAFLAGCSRGSAPYAPNTSVTAASSASVSKAPAHPELTVQPVRIGVIQDKTGSSGPDLTEQASGAQIGRLLDIVRKTGGEMAYAVIGKGSERPLIRVHLTIPPAVPQPLENPFDNLVVQTKYREKYSQWSQETNQRIAAFQSAIRPLLLEPATAERSPVWRMIREVDIFLGEPDAGRPTRRYLLLISDGLDTAGGRPAPLASGATVLLINGSGVPGSMRILKPMNLESVGAAARYIAMKEGGF